MAYARPPGSSASQGPLQPGTIGFTVPPPAYAAENREMPSGPVQPGLQEAFPSPRESAPGFSPTIMAAPYPPAGPAANYREGAVRAGTVLPSPSSSYSDETTGVHQAQIPFPGTSSGSTISPGACLPGQHRASYPGLAQWLQHEDSNDNRARLPQARGVKDEASPTASNDSEDLRFNCPAQESSRERPPVSVGVTESLHPQPTFPYARSPSGLQRGNSPPSPWDCSAPQGLPETCDSPTAPPIGFIAPRSSCAESAASAVSGSLQIGFAGYPSGSIRRRSLSSRRSSGGSIPGHSKTVVKVGSGERSASAGQLRGKSGRKAKCPSKKAARTKSVSSISSAEEKELLEQIRQFDALVKDENYSARKRNNRRKSTD